MNCLINGIFPYCFIPESLSTSPRQQENAILAITKENMRMEFSSFSFSGDIKQKSEESPLTLGCQTDHWNCVSQAMGPTGGSCRAGTLLSHHCYWGPQLFPSGVLPPSMVLGICVWVTLFKGCQPEPFSSLGKWLFFLYNPHIAPPSHPQDVAFKIPTFGPESQIT